MKYNRANLGYNVPKDTVKALFVPISEKDRGMRWLDSALGETELLWVSVQVKYCACDKVEKNNLGRSCSAYGGEERCIQGFGGETWRKEATWSTLT
jgi:hypothetical protein